VTALLQTRGDRVVANIVVEQGVDKIGGIPLDEIHTFFVQGDLVCCMTPWDFFEALKSCQKDCCLCAMVLEEDIDDVNVKLLAGLGFANGVEAGFLNVRVDKLHTGGAVQSFKQ
jgi:hypothetical protein